MGGVRMSSMNKCNESDWRLFRSRLPIWQEAYMERRNREYIALLSGGGSASEKFWELEKRVREDKKSGGVVMRMSRANMELNLLSLLATLFYKFFQKTSNCCVRGRSVSLFRCQCAAVSSFLPII